MACEFSGIVRDAFLARGHDAWSADLYPAPGPHIHGDVLPHLTAGWDLLIAHPPCTFLCNSGVRWLYLNDEGLPNKERFQQVVDGAFFFRKFLEAPIPRIAVENPVMHRYAQVMVGRGPTQIIQPWQFGHGEMKTTGLWLKNLPKLRSTKIVSGRESRIHLTPGGKNQWAERSVTYPGIAEAMATQWGEPTDVLEQTAEDRQIAGGERADQSGACES